MKPLCTTTIVPLPAPAAIKSIVCLAYKNPTQGPLPCARDQKATCICITKQRYTPHFSRQNPSIHDSHLSQQWARSTSTHQPRPLRGLRLLRWAAPMLTAAIQFCSVWAFCIYSFCCSRCSVRGPDGKCRRRWRVRRKGGIACLER